jgi:hypothetical protein
VAGLEGSKNFSLESCPHPTRTTTAGMGTGLEKRARSCCKLTSGCYVLSDVTAVQEPSYVSHADVQVAFNINPSTAQALVWFLYDQSSRNVYIWLAKSTLMIIERPNFHSLQSKYTAPR